MNCILRAVARWTVAGGCVLAIVGHIRAATGQEQFATQARNKATGANAWVEDYDVAQRSELRLVSHEERPATRVSAPRSSTAGTSASHLSAPSRAAVFEDPRDVPTPRTSGRELDGRVVRDLDREPLVQSASGDGEVQPASYEWHPTPQRVTSRPPAAAAHALATEDRFPPAEPRRIVAPATRNASANFVVRSRSVTKRTSMAAPMTTTASSGLRPVADERNISVQPHGAYLSPASQPLAPWQQRPAHRQSTAARPTAARAAQYELPPQANEPMLQPQPEYVEGEVVNEGMVYDGPPGEAGPDGYPMEYGGASCGHDYHGWHRCTGACCPYTWLDESSLLVGVQGFKNPTDLGRNGNFGFMEGVNFAGSFWNRFGIGYQVGARFAQSNLSGEQTGGSLDHSRDQVFLTSGLFQRAFQGNGLQWGVVFDWLEDQYFVDNNFSQVRAEASYLINGHEVGFWGAFGTSANKPVLINQDTVYFRTTDIYAFFYRHTLHSGGQGRAWVGFTGDGEGLVGADFRVPVSNNIDLLSGFNYVIPKQGLNGGGSVQEGWGLSMNVVWYPTRTRHGVHNGPYRALFNVADNSTLMLDKSN